MNYNTKVENDTTTSQCFSTSQQTLINMYVQIHHIPMPQQHQPHFPALSTPPPTLTCSTAWAITFAPAAVVTQALPQSLIPNGERKTWTQKH